MEITNYIAFFLKIFKGLERAHGRYTINLGETTDRKVAIDTNVVKKKVRPEDIGQHLRGTRGVQIVPVNDDGECHFGCIDCDDYSLDIKEIVKKVNKQNFPLVCCKTKSGGTRLFVFFKSPVPAEHVIKKLKFFASVLGIGNSEIFPKQKTLFKERGDIGNRVALPYFGFDSEEGTREYAIDYSGKSLSLSQFILEVESKEITKSAFISLSTKIKEQLPSGPPCLNLWLNQGIAEGEGRDTILFNIGLYLARAHGEEWKNKLFAINKEHFTPPLPEAKVDKIYESIEKKKENLYNYQCREPSLSCNCNSSVCRTKKYGIGSGYGLQMGGSLQKLNCEPPIWFLDTDEGDRLMFTTEQLMNQNMFQKVVLETLNRLPMRIKTTEWQEVVSGWLETLEIVPADPDATPTGRLKNLLIDFCLGTSPGKSKRDLMRGKIYTTKGRHYFLLNSFYEFLEKRNYKELPKNKVLSLIKELGAFQKTVRIEKESRTVWSIAKMEAIYIPLTEEEIEEEIVIDEDVL